MTSRRTLVINPNTSHGVADSIRHAVSACGPSVDVMNVPWGPESVESLVDSLVAANAVVETVWAHREDYSAFVVACFDDPGVEECREIVHQPVVGIGAAAIAMANAAFQHIGALIVADRVEYRVAEHFAKHGVGRGRLMFAGLDGAVSELNESNGAVNARFRAAGERLKQRGAECIVLACAGFSFQKEPLEAALGLPVLDGNQLATVMASSLARNGPSSTLPSPPQPFRGHRPPQPAWLG